MSQAGIISTSSGPVPPTVATSYVTDVNSPAIPAANVLNVLGNDTTDNDIDGIRTDGSSGNNTLTVQLTNRFYGTGTSTNGSNADLITFSLGASTAVYRFKFDVTGRETTTGQGVGYTLFSSFKTNGAAATAIQTPFIDADEDIAGAALTMIASGNNVILRATSSGVTTITYATVGSYVVI